MSERPHSGGRDGDAAKAVRFMLLKAAIFMLLPAAIALLVVYWKLG